MHLERFSVPAKLAEVSAGSADAWSQRLSTLFDDAHGMFEAFYNPLERSTAPDETSHNVTWPAAPGRLLSSAMSAEERWEKADGSRDEQDEYCEWSVLRDSGGTIQRITFTTEVPDYYDHLMDTDEELLERLYSEMAGQTVRAEDLRDSNGLFQAANEFNTSAEGPIVHLSQRNNTLRAAVTLAAEATILREKDGLPITHAQTLVLCGRLGDEMRHSDPQIASAVNNLVADRHEISLADPPGLYIDALVTSDLETPDGTDAQEFWHVERGGEGYVVRGFFEVPSEKGYAVGDIKKKGVPIAFGAQLAESLHVRLEATSRPSGSEAPARQPCVGS